jgi:hypothetical protein
MSDEKEKLSGNFSFGRDERNLFWFFSVSVSVLLAG